MEGARGCKATVIASRRRPYSSAPVLQVLVFPVKVCAHFQTVLLVPHGILEPHGIFFFYESDLLHLRIILFLNVMSCFMGH